jgi:hypothetical protein
MNYYRVGDRLPAFEIAIVDGGLIVDLAGLNVYVRWERADGSEIAERAATITSAAEGICEFVWQNGDLTVPGLYRAIVQLAPTATPSVRQSLAEPPLIEMEVLPNDFPERDTSLAVVPTPGADDVALLLGQPASELDANQINAAIQRARRLAYVIAHVDRIGGALGGASLVILEDLVTQLAALMISQPPSAVYGPFQKESIGSYSYDLKKASGNAQVGVFFGIPQIDELIVYFRDLAKQQGDLIGVEYPEWWQPITHQLNDPSRLGDLSL